MYKYIPATHLQTFFFGFAMDQVSIAYIAHKHDWI